MISIASWNDVSACPDVSACRGDIVALFLLEAGRLDAKCRQRDPRTTASSAFFFRHYHEHSHQISARAKLLVNARSAVNGVAAPTQFKAPRCWCCCSPRRSTEGSHHYLRPCCLSRWRDNLQQFLLQCCSWRYCRSPYYPRRRQSLLCCQKCSCRLLSH